MHVIPAPGRLREEDRCSLPIILGYRVSSKASLAYVRPRHHSVVECVFGMLDPGFDLQCSYAPRPPKHVRDRFSRFPPSFYISGLKPLISWLLYKH